MIPPVRGYIGIGSNLGDRLGRLAAGVRALDARDLRVAALSSVWETEPVGTDAPGWFINAVAAVDTSLPPGEVLRILLEIEAEAGRVRGRRNDPRALDLDLLWLGGLAVDEPGLNLPHPRMWDRRFVLAPLRELAPELADPVSGVTVAERLDRLPQRPSARRLGALDWLKGPTVYSRTL